MPIHDINNIYHPDYEILGTLVIRPNLIPDDGLFHCLSYHNFKTPENMMEIMSELTNLRNWSKVSVDGSYRAGCPGLMNYTWLFKTLNLNRVRFPFLWENRPNLSHRCRLTGSVWSMPVLGKQSAPGQISLSKHAFRRCLDGR